MSRGTIGMEVPQAGGLGEARGLEVNQPRGGYAEGVNGVGYTAPVNVSGLEEGQYRQHGAVANAIGLLALFEAPFFFCRLLPQVAQTSGLLTWG